MTITVFSQKWAPSPLWPPSSCIGIVTLFISLRTYAAKLHRQQKWCVSIDKNAVITPHACARCKVIGLSVCRRCRCPQKTRIFQDYQVQASREWHKSVKINRKLTYLCPYLLLTIHECNKLWFSYTTPIHQTYWGYSVMHYNCTCPSSI